VIKPRIITSLLTKDQEFQVLQAADAERAAARAGFDLEIIYARNNAPLQVEQLYRFIHAPAATRPVAIVVQAVSGDGLARVAHDAVAAGIGWVLLNRDPDYIDALRAMHAKLPISVVTIDQLAVGRIQGKQFRSLLPKGGDVLYVRGPSDSSAAIQRLQGMQETIAGANITVQTVSAEWTEVSGERAVQSWLRLSSSQAQKIDVVGAQNDAMAIGARKAIVASRPEWERIPFTGCDGLVDGGQRLVNERKLAGTIVLQPATGPAIDLVAAHLQNTKPAPRRIVLPARSYPTDVG
jgi:ABC-type sugar transport system substrate-binding protein